jgi:hypothetical protein
MITRFISDKTFKPLNFEYKFDSDLKIKSYEIGVDGNLNYSITPFLSSIKDLKINNYALNILSGNEKIHNILSINQISDVKNSICYIFYHPDQYLIDSNSLFWRFETNFVSVSTKTENFGDLNIFEIEFVDDLTCKIFYNDFGKRYAVAHSLSLSSIKLVPLTANNFHDYATSFEYIYNRNENQIIFYVNSNLGQFAVNYQNNILNLKKISEYTKNNRFFIKKIEELNDINVTSNWLSYENDYNKNNLNVNSSRSHYDLENNFLISSLIDSISSTIPINILSLKNQLNQENLQNRGNVFLNENEVNLKEYESIFTGGCRELGYDKINLGYTSYTAPFYFKSGKTTFFHVPHDIYPYKKLNINSSKLVESGAVAGNCPLNSDKVWKKMANYRNTSPYGNAQEENTGQWLCTWLSAGNQNTRPVWVDRFYKPDLITPFAAMSAVSNEITYKSSFDCYDLKKAVSDKLSSLTFERSCYYAYMHLGKKDYQNLIKSLSENVFYNKLETYKKTNYSDLDINTKKYNFDGKTFGSINFDKNFNYNNITFSFFAEKENWAIPTGNQIFGNYTNKGFGFYNYINNTNYILLKKDNTTLQILNNNFDEISNISTLNITKSAIKGIARRNGFENIHIITEDFKLIEVDLNGTIVDINQNLKSNLAGNFIKSVSNDDIFCYVQSNSATIAIDLKTNDPLIFPLDLVTAGSGSNSYIVRDESFNLYEIWGESPNIRGDKIYFINDNKIKTFLTSTSSTEIFATVPDSINSFNIDYDGKVYIISKNKLYIYNDQYNVSDIITLSSVNTYSLSARSFAFVEKFEYGVLKKYKNIFLKNNTESYIITLDENNNQTLKKLSYNYDIIQTNTDISNYKFNTQYVSPVYGNNSYNFKIKLLNQLNSEDVEELVFIINSKDLASGKRHFVLTLNCFQGIAYFYLDGQLYERKEFEPKKFIFSDTFQGLVHYGCNSFFNGIPAFSHFKDVSDFTCKDIIIEDIYILDKFIDNIESLYFYSEKYPPDDIIYNMPCGSRNFIDTIDKMFNFNVPQYKTNIFDLNILNSGIFYEDIKNDLESYINERLQEFLPTYSNLRNINWLDTVVKPIYIEGNFNQSNTLTNLL